MDNKIVNDQKLARPDFAIIGAMKSATSSLQEQLDWQPGVFTTEPKEPNFFSNDEIYAQGEAWYSGLFSKALASEIKGEASTHYTKLPRYPDTIERLKQYAPDTRLIYVMRHPLDRLISHYTHNWTMGFVQRDVDIESALDSYQNFIHYSCYSMQLSPWFDAFGKQQVLPVFFDRLLAHPQTELERICTHIGYPGKPTWQNNAEASNVSSQRIRKFPLYSALVESPLSTKLRKTLIPQSIRDKIKSKLRQQTRPELTEQTKLRLEDTFDKDLTQMGNWLGIDLNCKNFKKTTRDNVLEWAD